MIGFLHADPRFPFLWESARQPSARWHAGDGPVHYLADTPDGAWAEFLRHEGITDPKDVAGIARDLWAVDIPDDQVPQARPNLPRETLLGGLGTHSDCRHEARRLRGAETGGLIAPSAALLSGRARGHRVSGGQVDGPGRSGQLVVLFGVRPFLVGWRACARGRPHPELVDAVRQL